MLELLWRALLLCCKTNITFRLRLHLVCFVVKCWPGSRQQRLSSGKAPVPSWRHLSHHLRTWNGAVQRHFLVLQNSTWQQILFVDFFLFVLETLWVGSSLFYRGKCKMWCRIFFRKGLHSRKFSRKIICLFVTKFVSVHSLNCINSRYPLSNIQPTVISVVIFLPTDSIEMKYSVKLQLQVQPGMNSLYLQKYLIKFSLLPPANVHLSVMLKL